MNRPVYLLLLTFCYCYTFTLSGIQTPIEIFLSKINPTLHTTGPGAVPRENNNGNQTPAISYGPDQNPATATCGRPLPLCSKTRYRSIDGSCNNLFKPWWGTPMTPYGRLTSYNYGDGISSWPVAASGAPLPNPRLISRKLFYDLPIVDQKWNLNAEQWGQFIAHDMSLTAQVSQTHNDWITCCDAQGSLTHEGYSNPWCAPIIIPSDDPVYGPQGIKCMNFVRTATTRTRRCTSPNVPAEPLTAVTAYMDLSLVYGSTAQQAAPLRLYQGGRLLTQERRGNEWPPQVPNTTDTCDSAQSPREPCYLTGDSRGNQNTHLTILHILMMREHNRIADTLASLNPHWNDKIIFEEARRIHIAQYQHINYYEYLPIFLGRQNMVKNKLIYLDAKDYVNDYNPKLNPAVLNEHATAASRNFHTLIRGFLKLFSEARTLERSIRISDWMNRPIILELRNAFHDLTRGLTVQAQHFSDQFWDTEMTQFLFKRNKTLGDDLRAIDIHRGRDHGLGTYLSTRAACGLRVPKSFHDLLDFISSKNVQILKSIYKNVADVDLVVGGSLERLTPDALAGPTFLCILTEQFYRTRVGDRFFYENGADKNIAFTPSQLETIRQGSSVARIICDNTKGVFVMQPRAFQKIGPRNKLVPCELLPSINITLWKETNCH